MKDNPKRQWVDVRLSVMGDLKCENEATLKELDESGGVVDTEHELVLMSCIKLRRTG